MAQETLTYHPPKKEPSFINMYTFIGAIAFATSPMVAAFGAVAGSIIGKSIEKHQQEHGIKARKPDGSILNGTALMGAAAFALLAYGLAPVAASAAVVTAIVGTGAAVGGVLGGWSQNKSNAAFYDLALKQENERQAAISAGKEVSQYKNIADLPAIPQQTKDTNQAPFTERAKSTGQSASIGIN